MGVVVAALAVTPSAGARVLRVGTYHGVRGSTTSEPATDSRYSSLEKLASLHDRGAISDDEFAAEKAELLAHR